MADELNSNRPKPGLYILGVPKDEKAPFTLYEQPLMHQVLGYVSNHRWAAILASNLDDFVLIVTVIVFALFTTWAMGKAENFFNLELDVYYQILKVGVNVYALLMVFISLVKNVLRNLGIKWSIPNGSRRSENQASITNSAQGGEV
jgi:hypothetical protein